MNENCKCDSPHYAKGYCRSCYDRQLKVSKSGVRTNKCKCGCGRKTGKKEGRFLNYHSPACYPSHQRKEKESEFTKCILHNCNEDITGWRFIRGYKTCCPKHGDLHSYNRMTRRRARIAKKEVFECSGKGCNRIGIDHGKGATKCPGCQGNKIGRPPGSNSNVELKGIGGTYFRDFRQDICKSFKDQCADYSTCSDSCMERGGQFKYEKNGGVNCYRKPETRHLTRGDSFAVHTNNYQG